jgi:adenylate cyclase
MHVYLRGSLQQKLRLISGLVLFAFAAAHFLNHALGLVSLEAMHEAQQWRTAVTRSAIGTVILASALVIHIALALYKISRRHTWRMPRWEAVQILLGLAIPFLLFPHIVNTRIAHQFFGVEDSYLYELVRLWPDSAVLQSLLLLFVWTHGCLGLHYWLRLSDGYVRVAPVLLAIAIAVPVLALAGFAAGGLTAGDIMSDPLAFAALKGDSNWPNADDSATLAWLRTAVRAGFLALVVTVVGIALLRRQSREAMRRKVRVNYVDGPTFEVTRGKTLLEISRSVGMSHASVCGGRGRCSTCRVRVEKGLEGLPPPSGAEAVTLKSIEAPGNIRLACQIRPSSELTVAIVSHPATPGPPQDSFDDIRDFVAAHVRGVLGDRLVEVRSSDIAALARWLSAETGQPATVRDLAASGFVLEGVRIEFVMDRPTAAIIYRRQGRPVTLFQRAIGDSAPLAMRGQRNGYHVLAWTDEDFSYVAVSDLSAGDLDRLEEAFRPLEPLLKTDARAAVL